MAVYPYVQSFVDIGTAKGPRLAIVWHMAEGGGTVGYLSKPNPNGVSVHFVIERTGRTVQMLPLDHAHTSIRISDLRTTDDPPFTWAGVSVVYGRTARERVLGAWAGLRASAGPNHATIGVELEGFAVDGPSAEQRSAMASLFSDMADRFPGLRSLGHRDAADYKACPGRRIPWDVVGGHAPEDDMLVEETVYPFEARGFTCPAGATLYAYDPARPGGPVAKTTFTAPYRATCDATVYVAYPGTTNPPVPRGGPFLRVASGGFAGLIVQKNHVTLDPDPPAPAPDCAAAVDAATAPLKTEIATLNARIAAAKTALG